MSKRSRALGGRPGATTGSTLVALLIACAGANAQVPKVEVPLPGPVDEVVEATPVDEVVQASPVAPVREEVERLTREIGGGGGSEGTSSNPAPSPSRASDPGVPGSSGQGTPDNGSRPAPPARGDTRPRAGGAGERDRASGPRDEPLAPATRTTRTRAAREANSGEDGGGPFVRSITRIVGVVPTLVWIALGLLAIVALFLAARTLLDRRRVRVLAQERAQLLRDVHLLERTLLPPVPERLGGLAASVAYRPSEGPGAGGDFYDAFELADGRVAVLVGDVCGHGPAALEHTNSIRLRLRACLESGMDPRSAIESVANSTGTLPNGAYATAVVAVHDPHHGTLTYATAGHPPPIITGPAAHEPVTVAGSPPIGLGLRAGQRQTTVSLAAGSTACLVTDGVLEARVGEDLFGPDRLADLVKASGEGDSAAELLDRIVTEADEASDDMAVLLLRADQATVRGGARVEEVEFEAADAAGSLPRRFLEACGVDPNAQAAAESEIRAAASDGVLVRVTIEGETAAVSVMPSPPLALSA